MINSDFPVKAKAQFPYETKWNQICGLEILSLKDLDQTIDLYFKDYEKTQAEWLFDLCPYFGVIWPSSVALTKHLAQNLPNEETVLELGCGLAIPSLYLAKQGISVRATDFHPDVPFFLQQNVQKNSVELSLAVTRWREMAVTEKLIIGSDILYDRHQVTELLDLLKHAHHWQRAIFVDPGRAYWERFVLEAKKDFRVQEFLFESCFFCEISR